MYFKFIHSFEQAKCEIVVLWIESIPLMVIYNNLSHFVIQWNVGRWNYQCFKIFWFPNIWGNSLRNAIFPFLLVSLIVSLNFQLNPVKFSCVYFHSLPRNQKSWLKLSDSFVFFDLTGVVTIEIEIVKWKVVTCKKEKKCLFLFDEAKSVFIVSNDC